LVADPSGAAALSANAKATEAERGLVRTAVSGPDGTYVLPNLPVGPYELEVEASGFETYVQARIHFQVSENPTMNVPLRLGQVSEQVYEMVLERDPSCIPLLLRETWG
jgi:hypothetical protein